MAINFLNDGNFADNAKLQFGNSNDLEIYHDGSNSYIDETGTGNLKIRTNFLTIEKYNNGEIMASFDDDNAVSLYHNNSQKFATTSSGISVTGTITASGDVLDRDIPCWIGSNFLDGTASNIYVVPFNNNNEATVSAKTYYHFATMPYAGQLKRVTFKNVSGTPSTSSFTVQLFLYVNGSQQASSNEISWSNTNGITWSPTSSNTFSAGDEITIGYQKSTSSRTMAGVAAGVVVEFTDYDI